MDFDAISELKQRHEVINIRECNDNRIWAQQGSVYALDQSLDFKLRD